MSREGDFETYQVEFKKWQERFGLNGYQVYFEHKELEGAYADITISLTEMVATVRLNSEEIKHENPVKSAKHEAIHLLLNRLETKARDRHVSLDEINEAAEELAVKLQGLIKD